MMESPIIPTLLATNLSPGTYKGIPSDSNARVKTISSNVPIKYNRKVKFSDPTDQSLPSRSLTPEPSDLTHFSIGDEENIGIRARPSYLHLSQMEPLSATSLYQRQTLGMRPRIEIRLRRPCSLHDVSGEMAAKVDEQIAVEQEVIPPKGKKRGPKSSRSFSSFFKRGSPLFGSSPNLASFNETNKNESGDDSSSTRSRTASGSSYDSVDSPSQTRRPDFLRRFKRKKSNMEIKGSGKPLRIEIFKKQDVKNLRVSERENSVEIDTETDTTTDTSSQKSKSPTSGEPSPLASPSNTDLTPKKEDPRNLKRAQILFHFTCHVPCEGSTNTYAVVKDATNVLPLADNETLVTDILSNKMVLFNANGVPKVSFIFDEASEPWATCLTSEGTLAVTLRRHKCVSLWSLSGMPLSEFGHEVLVAPTGIQVDSKGRFVVADETMNRVNIFDDKGLFLHTINPSPKLPSLSSSQDYCSFDQPRYVCITSNGLVVITDSANHCIRIFDSNGNMCNRIGSFGYKDGQFRFPYGVACDSINLIYVADHFNHRISVFNIDGVFQYHALIKEDGIFRPKGLAVQKNKMYVSHGGLRAHKISVFSLSRRAQAFKAAEKTTKGKSVRIDNHLQ